MCTISTHYWFNRVYTIVVAIVETYLRRKSANFRRVVLVIFRYSAGTRITSIVAYSDFTSKSLDYVLSKGGLFSIKLSQTILPWTLLFYKTDTKSPFFSNFSRNHKMVSAHARQGKRLCAIAAQSWDHASVLRNPEIAQVYCAIPRSRNYSAQSRNSENAQRNVDISANFQIARNIYMYHLLVISCDNWQVPELLNEFVRGWY